VATESFCTVCQRVVYRGEDEVSACPVCSSPLLPANDEPGQAP
jgi:RNA polymerase subunit RPABC4/transcription elongation factor Spt4